MTSRSRCAVFTLLLAANVSCKRSASPPTPAAKTTPAFEAHWQSVASDGANVTYVEDDRAGALAGNVRRAARPHPTSLAEPAPAVAPTASTAMPEVPRGEKN